MTHAQINAIIAENERLVAQLRATREASEREREQRQAARESNG